ncbi:MAG: S-layer homology domain-containing protein [Oscillospiraceae bacterium]|nr:S-layer homology domain-containing protein [Oscillospiraceae bacterium]
MTRAEVTKIVSVLSGGYDASEKYPSSYNDVTEELWYYNVIGYASANGWVKGYLDNSFCPENTITRGEFAAVIVRYLEAEPTSGTRFTDTDEDAWYTGYITALADMGLVKGYTDGTYQPDREITRAEGITLINRMIGREPDKTAIDAMECPFSDLDSSHWAYYDIMAAACEY